MERVEPESEPHDAKRTQEIIHSVITDPKIVLNVCHCTIFCNRNVNVHSINLVYIPDAPVV
jgi:hypothetical protein